MFEQERQRVIHLLVLLSYTFLAIALMAESLMLGWEMGAMVLLLIGLTASWIMHITGKIQEKSRMELYFIQMMMGFFFYGIHETSIYDMAAVMVFLIIIFSATDRYSIIRLCVITYLATMFYDFVFVLRGGIEVDPLTISRLLLHLVLVIMAGQVTKFLMQKRSEERKDAKNKIDELAEVNRRTEDFLTNVSHELRTPINAVTGITTVMLKNEEDTDKRKNVLSIQKAGRRLFSQIEDILDYTEIDTGKIKVSEDVYMISSLVNDIINGSRLTEKENNLELVIDIDTGMPSAFLGDGKKVKKIIGHLIDNAVKFTKKGGVCVRIFALPKDYGINLCIKVSDTGIGIAKKELEKIKERFYQANGGRNRRAGGLGLGLPIVYGMVSAMEGFIQIESALGEGTTVSVSIPQKIADEAPGMVVENRQDLCLACFLKLEKYEIPKVRDYYNDMISHMVRGLEIPLHKVSSIDELKKLVEMYQLTHLFIGREEYEESQSYFENMDSGIEVVVVADESFVPPHNSKVRILRKPFNNLAVANLLKMQKSENGDMFQEKRLLCPNVRVLVVDDEPMNLMVAEGIFKEYQMNVTTAESGRKAIALCEKEEFDLIFLDHMMPEMDGVETLKRLHKVYTDTGRDSIVVAFTANAVSGAREMFLREGFDEFVSKPIETMELERVLRKVLPKSSIVFVDENYKVNGKKEDAEKKDNLQAGTTDEENLEQHAKENKMILLENAGIHTKSGIQYCGGDKGFYTEMLIKFAKDAKRKEEEIDASFKKEDFENYCILVHALKSIAKMIGADSLSENAKQAEMAAKNHDVGYIMENHEALLAQYQQVVQSIVEIFDLKEDGFAQGEKKEGTEISQDELTVKLAELKVGLDTFEANKAQSLIDKMKETVYQGVSIEELLYDVMQDLDDFEFGAASQKVETLIQKVERGEL